MKIFKLFSSVKVLLNNSLLREFSIFSSSTVVFQVVRVIVELIVANTVGPTLWGYWYLLNLIIAYRGVANLGIDNGMNREVPFLKGKGDKKKEILVQNSSFTFTIISSLIVSCALLFIGIYFNKNEWASPILLLIPLFWANQFYYLFSMSLKANGLFNLLSKMQLYYAIFHLLITVPLAYKFKLNGFIVGYSISLFIALIFVYYKSPIKYRIYLKLDYSKNLIRIGFPIMAVGVAYTLFNTLDRWIIGLMLDSTQLGYYSLSIIIFGSMILLPKIISQQIYPRMAYDWGKYRSAMGLEKWAKKQTLYTSYIVYVLVPISIIFIPFLIDFLLPEYREGILSVKIIMFAALFLPFSAGWGNVLNIINKQAYYLIVIIISILINLILNYYFVINGYGIEGVALSTVLSFGLYCVLIMLIGKFFLNAIK